MNISPDWVGAIGTWAQALLIVVSFWFILIQVKDLRRSLESNVSHNIYENMIENDRFFASNPHLRGYFYSGREIKELQDNEKEQILAIAEMVADCLDDAYQQQTTMTKDVLSSYKEYVRSMYLYSPALRQYISENSAWYPIKFINLFPAHPLDIQLHKENQRTSSPEITMAKIRKPPSTSSSGQRHHRS